MFQAIHKEINCSSLFPYFTLTSKTRAEVDKRPDSSSKCPKNDIHRFEISLATRCVSHLKAGMSVAQEREEGREGGSRAVIGGMVSAVVQSWLVENMATSYRRFWLQFLIRTGHCWSNLFQSFAHFDLNPEHMKQRPAVCCVTVMDR